MLPHHRIGATSGEAMRATNDRDSVRSPTKADLRARSEGAVGDRRSGRAIAANPQLATVEVVGAVAATRPRLPRLFRLLLALTGVRI